MARSGGLKALAFAIPITLSPPSPAVEPNEILDDPALEARARDLGQTLRCVVCQNQLPLWFGPGIIFILAFALFWALIRRAPRATGGALAELAGAEREDLQSILTKGRAS